MTAASRRHVATTVLVFALSFGLASASAAALSMTEACTLTVNTYAWYLDHPGPDPVRRAEEFASLFTDDASLTRPDYAPEPETFHGRAAIAQSYLETIAYSRLLYLTSNIRIMPVTDTTATGTSSLTVYMHADTGSMKDEGASTAILENRDAYEMTKDGCKFSDRTSTLRFLSNLGVIEPADGD